MQRTRQGFLGLRNRLATRLACRLILAILLTTACRCLTRLELPENPGKVHWLTAGRTKEIVADDCCSRQYGCCPAVCALHGDFAASSTRALWSHGCSPFNPGRSGIHESLKNGRSGSDLPYIPSAGHENAHAEPSHGTTQASGILCSGNVLPQTAGIPKLVCRTFHVAHIIDNRQQSNTELLTKCTKQGIHQ